MEKKERKTERKEKKGRKESRKEKRDDRQTDKSSREEQISWQLQSTGNRVALHCKYGRGSVIQIK